MPLDHSSELNPQLLLRSGHTQTILVARRQFPDHTYSLEERIDTPDRDFLDLFWGLSESDKLVILCHGLEGHAKSKYMLGMEKAFRSEGWDTLSWNYRSCSKEINLQAEMYHAGATDDLDVVCKHVASKQRYRQIVLVGFSLGGNLVLLYGSENRETLGATLQGIIAFSAPVDLASSSAALSKGLSQVYTRKLLRLMKNKVKRKAEQFPSVYRLEKLDSITSFEAFDESYVAPIHGFESAQDYWRKCSSVFRFQDIRTPSLLVNAEDDPFLGPECYPREQAESHPHLLFQATKYGGHTGFFETMNDEVSWAEKRALRFAASL